MIHSLHQGKLAWQWKMDPLKMYFLLKMGIFQCYISLPEGIWTVFWHLQFYAQKVQVSLEKNVLAFSRWRMASRLVLAWATPWPLATIWRSPKVRCVWLCWLKNLGSNWVNKTFKIFVSLINKKSPVEKGRKETSQCFFCFLFLHLSWAMKYLQLASSTKTPPWHVPAAKKKGPKSLKTN